MKEDYNDPDGDPTAREKQNQKLDPESEYEPNSETEYEYDQNPDYESDDETEQEQEHEPKSKTKNKSKNKSKKKSKSKSKDELDKDPKKLSRAEKKNLKKKRVPTDVQNSRVSTVIPGTDGKFKLVPEMFQSVKSMGTNASNRVKGVLKSPVKSVGWAVGAVVLVSMAPMFKVGKMKLSDGFDRVKETHAKRQSEVAASNAKPTEKRLHGANVQADTPTVVEKKTHTLDDFRKYNDAIGDKSVATTAPDTQDTPDTVAPIDTGLEM